MFGCRLKPTRNPWKPGNLWVSWFVKPEKTCSSTSVLLYMAFIICTPHLCHAIVIYTCDTHRTSTRQREKDFSSVALSGFFLFPVNVNFSFFCFYCWSSSSFILISPKNMFRFIKRMTISCSSRLKHSNVLLFTVAIVTCSSIKVGFLCWLCRCTTQSEPL